MNKLNKISNGKYVFIDDKLPTRMYEESIDMVDKISGNYKDRLEIGSSVALASDILSRKIATLMLDEIDIIDDLGYSIDFRLVDEKCIFMLINNTREVDKEIRKSIIYNLILEDS